MARPSSAVSKKPEVDSRGTKNRTPNSSSSTTQDKADKTEKRKRNARMELEYGLSFGISHVYRL